MQQQQQKNWTFCKILRKIKFVTHRDCTTNDLWECDEPCREYKESRKHLTDATKSLDRKKCVLKRVPVLVIKVSSDKYWFLPKHTLKGMDDVSDGHVLLRSMDGSCQVHSPVMRSWKIISEFEKQQTLQFIKFEFTTTIHSKSVELQKGKFTKGREEERVLRVNTNKMR